MKKYVVLDLPLPCRLFGGVIGTRLAKQKHGVALHIAYVERNSSVRVRFAELLLPADLPWQDGVNLAEFRVREAEGQIQLELDVVYGEENASTNPPG